MILQLGFGDRQVEMNSMPTAAVQILPLIPYRSKKWTVPHKHLVRTDNMLVAR